MSLDTTSTTDDLYIQVYSWEIFNNAAIKTIDKSCLKYNGTALPKRLYEFFGITDMINNLEYKKEIILISNNIAYKAFFMFEDEVYDYSSRARLFWTSKFTNTIKMLWPQSQLVISTKYYPFYPFKYSPVDSPPKIRFEKINDLVYKVNIICLEEIAEDIISQNQENSSDFSPRKEGKNVTFYGSRYERDPKNKVNAIAFHGAICKGCGFDFEEKYGPRGKGFIEIHHIKPLGDTG